ncbi:MAG: ParA family protein [Myxococcota bacterium]
MSNVKCIAVASRKGGVGKTTLVSALAVTLSRTHRVLVVDLDPQSNAAYVLGGDPTTPGTASLLMNDTVEPQQLLPNLHVLPGGPELTSRAIQSLPPNTLAQRLEGLPYDVILFDCPPGTDYLEWLALHAAHDVLVALDAHPLALVGAGRVIQDVWEAQARHQLQTLRTTLVLGRLDIRRSLDRQMPEALHTQWPDIPVFKVRLDATLAQLFALKTLAITSKRASEDMTAIVEHLYETNR